jgi:hypothetical protein
MELRTTRSPAGREAVLLTALGLPTLLLRAAQIFEQGSGPALSDLRGVVADGVAVSIAAGILCWLARRRRWVGIVFGAMWVLACYANYEHVRALDSLLNLDHAGYITDSTFFFGSALAPARPVLLSAALALNLGLLLYATSRQATPLRPMRLAAIGLVGLGLLAVWPLDEGSAGWRQRQFALSNVRARFDAPLDPEVVPTTRRAVADLGGEPRIGLPGTGRNVLLVILEGISGAHVASTRAAQGAQSPVRMPELDALAERGLVWSSFVALQRQTNRGEYALLCGDTPKLIAGTPKMTELTGMGDLPCLPARLADRGYATVYLQAAPLPFMLKDQFMAQAGFRRVLGDEWFDTSYSRNHWGNDDRAFFEGSLEMIRELEAEERPWFLTLMTVGTHHPYNVPEDFEGLHEPGQFAWAAEYLDRALGAFLRSLEAEGVLENTLVLITSDESSGLHQPTDDVSKALGQAWGLLIALTPEGDRAVVNETGLQSDLALSVLDYLGTALGPAPGPALGPPLGNEVGDESADEAFGGRSVFRRYRSPRAFAFGNTYRRVLGGVDESGSLFVCNQNASRCRKFTLSEGKLFTPERRPVDMQPEEVDFLKAKAIESLRSPTALPSIREYALIADTDVQLLSTPNMQLVFSGQGLSASPGDRIEVEIDVEAIAGAQGASAAASVWLAHDLISGEQKHSHYRKRLKGLRTGQRARIRYYVIAASALENIEARLRVHRFEGPAPILRFHAARLRVLPGDASNSPSGTFEEEFRITDAP